MRVNTKREMYRLLAAGAFGNTTPQYFSILSWACSSDYLKYSTWGVRTMEPGGPGKMYIPTVEVADVALGLMCSGHSINISPMIDVMCTITAWLEVFRSDNGLVVFSVEYPYRGDSWREKMPTCGKHCMGVSAIMLLKRHLNPNSLADLLTLLDQYPDSVVELSATNICLGVLPHRNAIIWEVRNY